MDIEELNLIATQFPGTLAFDTTYSYQIVTASPYYAYDVSFYKNPPSASINSIAYTAKATPTPVRWNGQNYQQFWSVNYEEALWATNGIQVPFTTTNIGMQFKPIATITYVSATQVTITITEATATLIIGDWVFINEVMASGGTADASTINLQSGFVTASANGGGTTTLTVRLPYATVAAPGGGSYSGGIVQYLSSNLAAPTKDCIRWYDGDPTSGTEFNPAFVQGKGWVNFAPPIYQVSGFIGDLPPLIYYLVGARMIIPYKDRLLFFGVVIQSSSSGPFYLQDTVIFSQNGTPFYTASFTGSPTSTETAFFPILTPLNQGAAPNAYFADVTGYGGYVTAGYSQPITTLGSNQDVLIVGFTTRETKLLYTGNDLLPFAFYIINSELGSTATFSSINLDRGVLTIGDRGITITDQQSCSRIDLEIPDQVFEIDLLNNGTQRVTAQRDYVFEWIYFSYPSNDEENTDAPFPNQTLFYNYRDGSWALFNESYTAYGPFRRQTGFTWQTVGSYFSSWNAWDEPWISSSSTLLNQEVIAGNQQGFIVTREGRSTSEAPSLYIKAVSGNTVTSPNHGLNNGDFVYFLNALGMTDFNSVAPDYLIWQVTIVDVNTFTIESDPDLIPVIPTGIYAGNGTITRLYIPQIQSKQFPVAWEAARKTRIGVQRYLFTTTTNAQITLLMYLSQNAALPNNDPPYVPAIDPSNASVVYSDILYTCQESTNIGLTPANTNLQQQTPNQAQTWHRMNTSLIGDTVQVEFTLNTEQMFDSTLTNQIAEIECHGMVIDVTPSQALV